jgi:hypothetical protein
VVMSPGAMGGGTVFNANVQMNLDVAKLNAGLAQARASTTTTAAAMDRSLGTVGSKTIPTLSTRLSSLGKSLDSLGKKTMTAGRTMTTHLTLPIAAVGAASVKLAADFDQSMRNVSSISDTVNKHFNGFSQQVLDLTNKLPQSADVLAKGLYNIVSSGFDGAKAMTVLKTSAEAASAGLSTTDVAAKAITAALNAYGLSVRHTQDISDTLFQGVNKGVMTFDELANSMGQYVGAASQLDVPLKDAVAAQAAMTLSGPGRCGGRDIVQQHPAVASQAVRGDDLRAEGHGLRDGPAGAQVRRPSGTHAEVDGHRGQQQVHVGRVVPGDQGRAWCDGSRGERRRQPQLNDGRDG